MKTMSQFVVTLRVNLPDTQHADAHDLLQHPELVNIVGRLENFGNEIDAELRMARGESTTVGVTAEVRLVAYDNFGI